MNTELIQKEILRRKNLFQQISYGDIATNVTPNKLRELQLYGGAAGIWVHSTVTKKIISNEFGIAVSILHTGKDYADDFSDCGILYDFPATNRRGSHDNNEIQALRNCYTAQIPLFVITKAKKKLRNVHIGLIKDFNEEKRKTYIEFVTNDTFIHNSDINKIDYEQADYFTNFEQSVIKSLLDNPKKRRQRIEKANKKPQLISRVVKDYQRNPDIVAEALIRAAGICEACGCQAPFNKKSNDEPYLEVHHLIPLSKGGEDSLDNVQSLCPNCHRKLHFG
ncbi:HNH endonuclease signature motif containing protein [Photobacterium damselae subsp. damselae]|uniref:HNH endonuclease n=1 Tax=Photobacterium damselae TaxID=38293 RepID=UPI00311B23A9